MLDASGQLVQLPYDLKMPFARFLAHHEISDMKRYAFGVAYRRATNTGLRPRVRSCTKSFLGDLAACCFFFSFAFVQFFHTHYHILAWHEMTFEYLCCLVPCWLFLLTGNPVLRLWHCVQCQGWKASRGRSYSGGVHTCMDLKVHLKPHTESCWIGQCSMSSYYFDVECFRVRMHNMSMLNIIYPCSSPCCSSPCWLWPWQVTHEIAAQSMPTEHVFSRIGHVSLLHVILKSQGVAPAKVTNLDRFLFFMFLTLLISKFDYFDVELCL